MSDVKNADLQKILWQIHQKAFRVKNYNEVLNGDQLRGFARGLARVCCNCPKFQENVVNQTLVNGNNTKKELCHE